MLQLLLLWGAYTYWVESMRLWFLISKLGLASQSGIEEIETNVHRDLILRKFESRLITQHS